MGDATGLAGVTMDAQQREYDRFGPWAVEISAEDPPPPLFLPHLTRAEPALLSVKVPRRIERRNARPGMDLYDWLVCLYDDELVVLQRVGQEVKTRACRLQDVQHVRVSRNLLRGNIRVGLADQPIDLPYSTVADQPMQRLVDLVRERYAARSVQAPDREEPEVRPDELSFHFERLLMTEREQHRDLRLLALQGTIPLASLAVTRARRYALRASGKRLLESMHLCDGREMKIFDRGQVHAYRWETILGTDTCYIPLANLRSARWHEDPSGWTVTLSLGTSGGENRYGFVSGNPSVEPYAAFLSALVERASATASTGSHQRVAQA
jgi:hypothetical protein